MQLFTEAGIGPMTINSEAQTEKAKFVGEEVKGQAANSLIENPEKSAESSFSNKLPSDNSNDNQIRQNSFKRPPKEENRYRKIGISEEDGEQEIFYDLSNKKKVKIGTWPE